MANQNLCEMAHADEPTKPLYRHAGQSKLSNRLRQAFQRPQPQPPTDGFKKKDGIINEQISGWPVSANAALTFQEFTKTSINIEQFSYVSKLVALTYLYVELSLPLPAALRAAEADLH
jgi:hypothetical protein